MRVPPRVLIVSACSKGKRADAGMMQARLRYTGRAHARIGAAVDWWRQQDPFTQLEWVIVSAGFGVLDESTAIPWYDATFTGLSRSASRSRAAALEIAPRLQEIINDVDFSLLVLPRVYLDAIGILSPSHGDQWVFTSPGSLPERPAASQGPRVIPCGVEDARRLGVSPREVAAARFESFVRGVVSRGWDAVAADEDRGCASEVLPA